MQKLKILGIGIIIICSFSWVLQGKENKFNGKIIIGDLVKSERNICFNQQRLQTFELEGECFIPIENVRVLRGTIEQRQDGSTCIRLCLDEEVEELKTINDCEGYAYLNPNSVYIENQRIYSILVDNQVFIPVETLRALWKVQEVDEGYEVQLPLWVPKPIIEIEDDQLINLTPYPLLISYEEIYWEDHGFRQDFYKEKFIEGYGSLLKEENSGIFLTTHLLDIQGIPIEQSSDYSVLPMVLYEKYEKHKRMGEVEKLFPAYQVLAKLEYKVGGIETNVERPLWRSEKNRYHVLIREDGKKVNVPWGSIKIVSDSGQCWYEAKKRDLEDFVNLHDYESITPYLVWTDVYRQRTYIFEGMKNQWTLTKVMRCSTGKNTSLTPTGVYELEYKMPFFGMDKGFRCKYAVVITRDYMYHSVLFDESGTYVKEGAYQLGSRVSHGCVRLSEEDSEWFYKNVPIQTKAYIR